MVGGEELAGMNGSGPMGHGSPIRDHGEDAGKMVSSPRGKTRSGDGSRGTHDDQQRGGARAAHLSKALEATVRQIEGTERERGTRQSSPRCKMRSEAARGWRTTRRGGRRTLARLCGGFWLPLRSASSSVEWGGSREGGDGSQLRFKEAERGGKDAPTSKVGAAAVAA